TQKDQSGSSLLTGSQKKELLRLARQAITQGCSRGTPPEPKHTSQPPPFLREGACFVTLHKSDPEDNQTLRGCIGSTQAYRPLLDDVMNNAFASAFRDQRFPPVTENELGTIQIEISILTPQQPMAVSHEKDLLQQLRPGVDGLLIRNPRYSATFLPQVWEQLPNPRQFLAHLKHKAGIPPGIWPEDMECFRYQCFQFEEQL
ncbi:MAG: AmmeMemoRadiSam system protein A, partial [Endozoicomonas sp.]